MEYVKLTHREMQFDVDRDVQAVLEFMQSNIHTGKLVAVADVLPQMGRLLWGHYAQESFIALGLFPGLPVASASRETRQDATESVPIRACAGDGSVAEECAQSR